MLRTLQDIENTINIAKTLNAIQRAQKICDMRDTIELELLDETIAPEDYVMLIEAIDNALSQN